jgi:hypothetical protein
VSDDLSIPNPGYRGNRAGRYGTGQGRVGQGMDPDTRRLVMFAGGLGIVLVGLIGASTLIGHRSNEIPVVAADNRPIRVKPDNPGGMKIDGAENDVFSGGSDTADSKLAPPAENPDTKALRTEATSPPPVIQPEAPTAAVAPSLPPAKPAIVTNAPAAAKPAIVASAPAATKPAMVANAPAATKPAIVASVPTATKSMIVATPPAAAKTEPAAKQAVALNGKPSAAADTHPPAAARQAMVQLAAVTSEEAARDEWHALAKRMPDLLNGRQPIFSRTDHDGHTFWRVRTSGFADVAQARAFCDHVRAKGGGCSVADF